MPFLERTRSFLLTTGLSVAAMNATAQPVITTLPAGGVSYNVATLGFNINPSSLTLYYNTGILFGTTPAYGDTLACYPSSVTNNMSQPVSTLKGNLTPNTTYYFRPVVHSPSNMIYYLGQPMSFTTQALSAPTFVSFDVAYASGDYAYLTAYINPNNSDASVVLDYGPTAAYGDSLVLNHWYNNPLSGGTPQYTQAQLFQLGLAASWHYRWRTKNAYGTTTTSDSLFRRSATAVSVITLADIKLFPNPVRTQLTVSLPENPGDGALSVIDITGKLCDAATLWDGKTCTVNTALLPLGTYVLRITMNGITYSKLFLKQ